ncbi:hypothetical protein F5Y04DRAFT_233960 [Hypomontagnella monticulosa]|nr:hypothetical protein F5Y04DRAFT_233960 [Hypomontagnella monticulosa]
MASLESKSSRFQWEQSQPGVWERDIDECEEFYKLSTRKGDGCYPVTACASFVTESSTATTGKEDSQLRIDDALRKAWSMLNYEHPTLRSRIERDDESGKWKRTYSTFPNEDEKKCWLDLTFKVVDVEGEVIEWFNNETASFEISTLFLVGSKKEDEACRAIFLRCPHDITDGVGILQLLDRLFALAALAYEQGDKYTLPVWDDEGTRLSPCLRLAAAVPESFSEDQTNRFQDIQTRNGAIYNHPSLLGLPPSSIAATSQDKRQRVSLSVPKVTTERVLRGCKGLAPGVSVTHVFMSALALALSELQPQKEESYPVRYVNHSMMNLRPYCLEPYNTPKHAGAPYHAVSAEALGIDLDVPGSNEKNADQLKSLPQAAIKVRDFYKTIRPLSSTDEQVILAPLMFKALTPPPNSDPHAASDPPFCPVPLSSIGNVASMVAANHGPFELTNVWAASEPIGAGVAVFLGTWDGQIELSAVFDTRYHDAGYVKKFLDRILNCVYRGLGIDNEHTSATQVAVCEDTDVKKRKRADTETLDKVEGSSLQRPVKSPARSPLKERPELENVQRQASKKLVETGLDEQLEVRATAK